MSRSNPYPINYPLPTQNIPTDLKMCAEWHENNRQRAITQVLMDLFLVAVKNYIKKGQTIKSVKKSLRLEGAEWQSWESTKGNQAAHCIPRQLYIESKPFDEFLEKYVPSRVVAIVFLFAETDDLPANYNRADSLAETKGLTTAFLEACILVITKGHTQGKFEADSAIECVKAAYSLYKSLADNSFAQSIKHLEDNLRMSGIDAQARKRREERIQILKHYKTALQNSAGYSAALTKPVVEGLLKVYQ
jgi:hypothetical protein